MRNKALDEENLADKSRYDKSTDDSTIEKIASNTNEEERILYHQYIEKLKKYNS
ncbi:hypothetical protein [Sulfurovum sp.]|uniref:hypothetical protein n=1 Tax=Sulfurovum sp. TaxID=1969726 RepID=UPI002868377C|nr:hypothetical protein [Sulfurovum sp.]